MINNCYFFVDCSQKEQTMNVMCEECRDLKHTDLGWFWDGSKGYGPYDYACCFCDKKIYEYKKNN